ncbi:MAG: hypothetical protein DRJ42_12345, partial [Deltaproteobacteria bacterium]
MLAVGSKAPSVPSLPKSYAMQSESTQSGKDPGQTEPQRPQLSASVATSASQPLTASPSQSPKPTSQAMVQAPATHAGLPLSAVSQRTPQPPQFRGSSPTESSQPFVGLPSQSMKPVGQSPESVAAS